MRLEHFAASRRANVQHRPPAIFIAGSLGLDFLNSIATPVDRPVDWLDSGDGLLWWLAQAKLVPVDALDELKARATPGELDKVAGQARALREWFRSFVRKHMGRPLTPKADIAPTPQRWRPLGAPGDAALALPAVSAAADRRSVGEVRV
jgi:hypothetical protein